MSEDDVLELVLGKLDGVRKQSGYWMARCPAHEDGKASLSVKRGTVQPVLLHCYAECDTADVLAAIGLTTADISSPREERQPDGEWMPGDHRSVAIYDYTDERGKLLFQVLRSADKHFVQRHPDPSAKSGWAWNMKGVTRVPYRLPQLRKAATGPAAGRVVYIVEGEKDVHAIEAAGAVATCNPGGAKKWQPAYGKHLDGFRKAIIVADRDEAGREHALQVAERISGHVPHVVLVEAAEGKDAADHLGAGHGLGDFRQAQLNGQRAGIAIETKKEERTNPGEPPVPSADPVIFTGILGEITAAAVPSTEADPVGIFASLLAGTGAFIGPDPHVQVGNIRHPLLIWPLLMGRTGSGRKGEATTTSEIFLRMAKPSSYDEIAVSGLSSGEGLIERIKDGEHGHDDKRLLVTETEFTSVMARSRREGSTLAAVQRQAWDGRALSVLNRHQLKASRSHIAIIGHITPREFRMRLAESDLAGGTYNRYLPLFVERTRLLAIPPGIGEEIRWKLGNQLSSAIDQAEGVARIQLDSGAARLWEDEVYPELTGADDEDHAEAEFTRRAAPYCLRIAGLLAALEGRQLIRVCDLQPAAALVRYSIASAKYVLDRQARDPRLDRIKRAVDGAGDAGLTRSAISGLFSRNLTKEVLDELLTQLTDGDGYEVNRQATKGRPAETFRRVVSSSFVSKDSP